MEMAAVTQCSGNSQGFFQPRVAGGQWANGAMGNARWTGVRLKDCVFENVAKPDVLENVKDIILTNVTINGKLLNQTITR